MPPHAWVACPDCDLLHRLDAIPEGTTARCRRCRGVLCTRARNGLERTLALSIASAMVFETRLAPARSDIRPALRRIVGRRSRRQLMPRSSRTLAVCPRHLRVHKPYHGMSYPTVIISPSVARNTRSTPSRSWLRPMDGMMAGAMPNSFRGILSSNSPL
jgi:hypothetical protein